MAKRDSVRSELAGWFGDDYESLEIAATFFSKQVKQVLEVFMHQLSCH